MLAWVPERKGRWLVSAEGEAADKSGHAPSLLLETHVPAEERGSDTLFLVKTTLESARVSLPGSAGWRWGHAWGWELH